MYYQDGNNWINVPYWAASYIYLGSAIAAQENPLDRLIIGLAVPVRAYAAALIALGIVTGRAKIPLDIIEESEYLNYLKNIESGSSIFYLVGENWYPGEFVSINEKEDGVFVHVIWKKGRQQCNCGVPLKDARKSIRIIGSTKNDSHERIVSRRIIPNKEFLDLILDGEHANEFVLSSRLECIIIGCINTLRYEIKGLRISFGAKHIDGTIQDVLRVKKFLSEGSAYRSNIIPADRDQSTYSSCPDIPYMTIFDGALSFLKWRDYWRKSNWIVLLDKTEPCFHEAADQLNKEYVERRVTEPAIENMPVLPKGVELLAFQEYKE